ncbi:STAS domain-containing protein, partial [Anaerostipes caccae]
LGRYKQLKPLGGTVSVVNVNDVVKRIVHMAGLHKIINGDRDREDKR